MILNCKIWLNIGVWPQVIYACSIYIYSSVALETIMYCHPVAILSSD
jgi:hypothetical protein